MSEPKEITPTGSAAKVYLVDVEREAVADLVNEGEALRAEAAQKLIDDFGFSEAMARTVVGT